MEFIKKPIFQGIKQTHVSIENEHIMQEEIDSLMQKNAIEIVPKTNWTTGFYSTLFLVKKKTGDLRPVINLKPLNRYLRKQHFKMDTLTKVLNLVQKNDWAISFDLKDAYFHIGIFKKHRKFLRFAWKGKVFQFKTLCFGPTVSPRVFTKILSVVAAYLRVKAIRLAVYLDDWIQLNQERQILLTEREITLNLLLNLGFIINKNKSTLIPVQILTYLGTVFQLKKGLVYPTAERFQKLVKAIHLLINGYTKARQYLVVLGMMASTLEIVPNARLYMRPLQMHLLRNWSPARMSLHWEVPCTQSVKSSLHWWLHQANF